MKWLLLLLGLPRPTIDRDRLMTRVRSASDEHTAEATSSSERVDNVIFATKMSSLLTATDLPEDARRQAVEQLLEQRRRMSVEREFLNRARGI